MFLLLVPTAEEIWKTAQNIKELCTSLTQAHHPSGYTCRGNSESATECGNLSFCELCPLIHGNTIWAGPGFFHCGSSSKPTMPSVWQHIPLFFIKFLCFELTGFIHLITSTWIPAPSMQRNWRNYFSQCQLSRNSGAFPPNSCTERFNDSIAHGLAEKRNSSGSTWRRPPWCSTAWQTLSSVPRSSVISSPPLPHTCKLFWGSWPKHSTLRFIWKISSYVGVLLGTELHTARLFPKTRFLGRPQQGDCRPCAMARAEHAHAHWKPTDAFTSERCQLSVHQTCIYTH